jgi:tetratricopeptide (TPR) repeat protein
LSKAGNIGGALTQFRLALGKEPGHIAARSWLISLLVSQQQLGPAQKWAEETVQMHPNEAICHLDLATVLEQQGRMQEALIQTRRAVELAPDDPDARLKLALRLFDLRQMPEAILACREGLRLAPTDAQVHLLLGLALGAEASKSHPARELGGREPLPSPQATPFSYADTLNGEAINHLRLVCRLLPNSPEPLAPLAWMLATNPRAELRAGPEAVKLAERATKMSLGPPTLLALAAAYGESSQYEKAIAAIEQANKLLEQEPNADLRERSQRLSEHFRKAIPFRQKRLE